MRQEKVVMYLDYWYLSRVSRNSTFHRTESESLFLDGVSVYRIEWSSLVISIRSYPQKTLNEVTEFPLSEFRQKPSIQQSIHNPLERGKRLVICVYFA